MKKRIALHTLLFIFLAACSSQGQPVSSPQSVVPTTTVAGKEPRRYIWPAADMGGLPDPGKEIYAIAKNNGSTSVDYLGLDEQTVRNYIQLVISLGHEGEVTELKSGGFMFNGTNAADASIRVFYTNTRYTVITYKPAPAGTTPTLPQN